MMTTVRSLDTENCDANTDADSSGADTDSKDTDADGRGKHVSHLTRSKPYPGHIVSYFVAV